jgi:hypothetical protein
VAQLVLASIIFLTGYFSVLWFAKDTSWSNFFNIGIGYWIIVFGFGSIVMLLVFFTRKQFGIKLHFLNK